MANGLKVLFLLGRPLSPLYGFVMKIREKMYLKGILRQHHLQVPVISIGNLVLGGTGKTPTVQSIASLLQTKGYSPAIISRGYGGKANNRFNVVSNRHEILLSVSEAGDEPYLLAKTLPGIPVLTGRKRCHPCHAAVKKYQADVIILDDGFQHLSVKRDIDIVLFDSTYLAGNSRIFPGGPLREPVSALHRCSFFLLTGNTQQNKERSHKFAKLLESRFADKKLFYSQPSNFKIVDFNGVAVSPLKLGETSAFCGIGNPERFQNAVDLLEIKTKVFTSFPDHARYTQAMVDQLTQSAVTEGVDSLLTTEKDMVKLRNFSLSLPIYCLQFIPTFSEGFTDHLLSELQLSK